MAAKTGFYHAPFAKPQAVKVTKENPDKTVDLAGDDGKVFVKSCPVADAPKHGHVTLGDLPKTAEKTETETNQ